jgi:hypothetical protein
MNEMERDRLSFARAVLAPVHRLRYHGRMIPIKAYPQLRQIAWQMPDDATLEPAQALGLYERNWVYVDKAAMTQEESAFLQRLIEEHGNGCFAAL